MVHQLVAQRLVERAFSQPLINNAERGQYVECMIELALSDSRPHWHLTGTWDAWDLVQLRTGARIEVKQSAAAQPWTSPQTGRQSSSTFDIAPRNGYYINDAEWYNADPPQRFADLYIFAHHDVADLEEADHRDPNQWRFYVIRELDLPAQKSISLNPLKRLATDLAFGEVAAAVNVALDGLRLKRE